MHHMRMAASSRDGSRAGGASGSHILRGPATSSLPPSLPMNVEVKTKQNGTARSSFPPLVYGTSQLPSTSRVASAAGKQIAVSSIDDFLRPNSSVFSPRTVVRRSAQLASVGKRVNVGNSRVGSAPVPLDDVCWSPETTTQNSATAHAPLPTLQQADAALHDAACAADSVGIPPDGNATRHYFYVPTPPPPLGSAPHPGSSMSESIPMSFQPVSQRLKTNSALPSASHACHPPAVTLQQAQQSLQHVIAESMAALLRQGCSDNGGPGSLPTSPRPPTSTSSLRFQHTPSPLHASGSATESAVVTYLSRVNDAGLASLLKLVVLQMISRSLAGDGGGGDSEKVSAVPSRIDDMTAGGSQVKPKRSGTTTAQRLMSLTQSLLRTICLVVEETSGVRVSVQRSASSQATPFDITVSDSGDFARRESGTGVAAGVSPRRSAPITTWEGSHHQNEDTAFLLRHIAVLRSERDELKRELEAARTAQGMCL